MNLNTITTTKEAVKTTGMLKPTTEITKIISNEYLKELELTEYCKIVESDFTKFQEKFQALMAEKNQSARIKAEFKSRNKVNVTNSESLLKALNELYKYKCELKTSYVATDKALKVKRLKYKKILSGYESAWNEALNKFNKMSVVAELLKIQEENQILEREIENQEKLTNSTKIQFVNLKNNIEDNFSKKIVQFSKFMTQYKNLLTSQKQNEKKQLFKAGIPGKTFKLFRTETSILNDKNSFGMENNDDANAFSSVDVTIFDEIMVPSENLEIQNLEEDGYSYILQNDMQQSSDTSKNRMEGLECLNTNQEMTGQRNKNLSKDPKENVVPVPEENESRYFCQQQMEFLKQSQVETQEGEEKKQTNIEENVEGVTENLKGVNGATAYVIPQMESEDEAVRNIQMECEESLSEGSYEKQYSIQREVYDCQKASSISSDDLPPSGENPKENIGTSRKPHEEHQNKNFKPHETETNNFKSFTGFFTLGSDNDNPTPSIFKLF